jgi:DNA polymerase-3 subunit beta
MDLNVRTQTMNVRCGSSTTDLKCIDSQEFPPMPLPDPDVGIELSVADLKEMISQVVFAASTDEARPILTGVLMKVDGNRISLAAADGFRLSVRDAELSSPVDQPFKAVIPARALSELSRISTDGKESVRMILPDRSGRVIFQTKEAELVSQLIEGTFPDYEQIIPQSYKTRTVLPTASFLKACKQAEIFAREGSLIARVNIIPGGDLKPGTVEISGQSEETGSNQTIMDASIEGPPLLIAFNVRFLREVLDIVKTPNVALETSVDTSPGVIRPVGDSKFLHVIMPMHLGG